MLTVYLADQGRLKPSEKITVDAPSAAWIDLATGQVLKNLTHSGKVNAVAISAAGQVGVTGAEDGEKKPAKKPVRKRSPRKKTTAASKEEGSKE